MYRTRHERRGPIRRTGRLATVSVGVGVLVVLASSAATSARAQAVGNAPVRTAQVLEFDRTGVSSPVGLAFAPAGSSFHVVEGRPVDGAAHATTDVVRLTPFALQPGSDRSGSARIAAAVGDPINVAFDARRSRLLLLGNADRLLEVRATANGELDAGTLEQRDARRLDLGDPQGMAVDPESGTLYVLDASQPRIVRIEPAADGGFETASSSEIDLRGTGITGPRGLALDPSTGNFHTRSGEQLYELGSGGSVVAVRDLSGLDLVGPEGMAFAPSADQTDPASQLSVYVADSGRPSGQRGAQPAAGTGKIVELAIEAFPPPQGIDFVASLVQTINTAAASFSPPSPDPSGIAYIPPGDRLMMSDGEVEETVNGISHFQGANVWELTRSGSVIRTANISKRQPTVVPMTDEPTGVAFKAPGTYFFTEDGGKRVYTLNPGGDALVGTADDTWVYFLTSGYGNGDPEGIAYDSANNRLFVADGVNQEIYQYTLAGSLVDHFDVAAYGVGDPEAVEFNPVTGTLFTLSNRQSGPIIVETTTSGTLIQTIDARAVMQAGAWKPAGIASAPASDGSGAWHLYLADRGIDNNDNPNIVDGKIFEITAPPTGTPPNQAPTVSAGPDLAITLPASASLDGAAADDGLPTPPSLTTTWSKVSGPGTVSFGTPNAQDTTATFSMAGTYVVRLTASDGALSSTDEATITVNPAGTNLPPTVSAGPDQAITLPSLASLDGTASDDGVPAPPTLTTTWSKVSGPGTVTFGTPNAQDTTAAFSLDGVYVLRLTASDGALSTSDDVTVTVNPAPTSSPLYFSLQTATTVGGVAVANEDVVHFDGSGFSLQFDGSDVGISTLIIDAFAWLDADSLLFSFTADKDVPGLGLVDDSDIFRFDATSLGTTTSGSFSLYFDGSDVGLTASAHDVDAIELLPDDRILLSTTGPVTVGSVSAADEDLLAFAPTSLGTTTSGSFSLYFDGSDVAMTTSTEDVDAVAVDSSGRLDLSTSGDLVVTGLSAFEEDVSVFAPASLGATTTGSFEPTLHFDGSSFGLGANDVFAVDLGP